MKIGLVDHTTGPEAPADGELARIANAISRQATHDFEPLWHARNSTVIVGEGDVDVHLFNDPDTAGALGYHDVDPHGLPYAHVFASPSLDAGSSWVSGEYAISTTISHEVLEALADLTANLFAIPASGSTQWAYEVCDPVEAQQYSINGVAVSNFVLPSFFSSHAPGHYDWLGKLTRPFTLAKGGYAILASWSNERQKFAKTPTFDVAVPDWQRALKLRPGSRTTWRMVL